MPEKNHDRSRCYKLGAADIERLHPIYRFATDFSKLMGFPFTFSEDSGSFETVIAIDDDGRYQRAEPEQNFESYGNGWHVFVPDILDYENKIIIEFEEESKPQKGPKIRKKGHWEESKRDIRRDQYYRVAGFSVFKIWQNQYKKNSWKIPLVQFLIEYHENQKNNL